MWIYRLISNWKQRRRQARRMAAFINIPEFQGDRLDRLLTLVSLEDFPLFLEYLGLTVNEKLTILSSIDLLDETKQKEAIRLQQQMRGMLVVFDLAEYLIKLIEPKKEDTHDLEQI